MARSHEQQEARSPLGSLQDLVAEGSQALIEGAQTVQRIVLATGRGVEGQVSSLVGTLESVLSGQLDALVTRFAASIRAEVDRVNEQVRGLEERFGDLPSLEEGIDELVDESLEPVRTLANGADQRSTAALARATELLDRMERIERRLDVLPGREVRGGDDTLADRVDALAQRLAEVQRELGTRLSEVGPLRERVTRMESRVLETSKEQIARAGEATGMRDRLARLEARLTDLSREQVARAVESAGLRERVFRLEQRSSIPDIRSPASPGAEARPEE